MAIASLSMYDLPELRGASDAWWRGLAAALRRAGLKEVPERITREDDLGAPWRDPRLLFSQCCGYPLTHEYDELLQYVATPCYAADGCDGPLYSSAIVIRADSAARTLAALQGGVCAANSPDSNSGYNVMRAMVAPLAAGGRFFTQVVFSGGHAASLAHVRDGKADVAAVDCVTYALLARNRPAAVSGVRVLCHSMPSPGLPYVTRAAADGDTVQRLRDGLHAAFADRYLAPARDALLLAGVRVLPQDSYERIVEIEQEAIRIGYPELS